MNDNPYKPSDLPVPRLKASLISRSTAIVVLSLLAVAACLVVGIGIGYGWGWRDGYNNCYRTYAPPELFRN